MENLKEHFQALAERFAAVRVCCGDWKRICGPSPTFKQGLTGVFLDPPYAAEADRNQEIYAEEDLQVAHEVREWAIEQGRNPLMRIALCGYEGEHKMPDNWKEFSWKAHGGYASTAKHTDRGAKNRSRERIWFSPHCLRPNQPTLFGQLEPEDLGEPEDLEE
jgi:site-specific DNA-adenine methylase